MLRLWGPAAEKPKVLKSCFFTSKSPVLAAKNAKNGAFLAHPEPEILLIEVAYFSAPTEYTFSAHCIHTGLSKRDRLTRLDTPRSGMLGIVDKTWL
jgi:hypothetical protein